MWREYLISLITRTSIEPNLFFDSDYNLFDESTNLFDESTNIRTIVDEDAGAKVSGLYAPDLKDSNWVDPTITRHD